MAFNKSKALESALKFLNQGKVPQAIAEYQQILRNDAKDQATLMTVGDLYARQGDMSHAIEYFERLAQVYLNDGFNSKAIAIYKKIAKLAPNELAPLERLADLYVQQGVLSEARPLFLQIAEAHLKANHAQKAVEVLHRLLDVEPENLRVQMRLAELYNVMGQKKEAAQTYLNYAQRLLDRGEHDEAEKLVERAIEVDPASGAAVLLRAKSLISGGKDAQAIPILESHPEANAGGEVTSMLLDLEIKSGQLPKAAERARKQLARGHEHTAPLYTVVEAMIAGGQAMQALPILEELRTPMYEAGEQDKFLKAVSAIVAKHPQEAAPLELMVDFCRYTSNSHQLPLSLSQLADLSAAKGNYARAEECLQELIDRNKNDERLVERLNQLRAKTGRAAPSVSAAEAAEPPARIDAHEKPVPSPAPEIVEETYDEETQKYIAQALTDVDLFSSYGLTQKATHLLENVLQRAPRHTPTLERLLDLHLGAGNERRTAELAAQLEQIHRERNDTVNADRFLELRDRFQKAAGIAEQELPSAPPVAAPAAASPAATSPAPLEAQASAPAAPVAAEPPAFEVAPVPVAAPEAEAPSAADAKFEEFEISLVQPDAQAEHPSAAVPVESPAAATPVATAPTSPAPSAEVDLSDEWEAMIQDVADTALAAPVSAVPAASAPVSAAPSKPASQPPAEFAIAETVSAEAESETEAAPAIEPEPEHPEPVVAQTDLDEPAPAPPSPEPEVIELKDIVAEELGPEPAFELVEDPTAVTDAVDLNAAVPADSAADSNAEAAPLHSHDFELELHPESKPAAASKGPSTTEDFISELVAEIDGFDAPATPAAEVPGGVREEAPASAASLSKIFALNKDNEREPEPVGSVPLPHAAGAANGNSLNAPPAPQISAESLNQLSEVFQEFRAELGELGEEDEDLETHYNLGIAYREMGLLDEAIGEFQKVAKAVQKGKPFRYTMNCSTMLGLCFMDKGEPKVASMWYQRALESPGLEQDAVLALRYDLGMALENAGESKQALDSFRQVYAMNIDYRDVADRIAELQKH
jgi:pilus assembly protein FimV